MTRFPYIAAGSRWNMVTAAGALQEGSLDEAVAAARLAIELAGPLQSSRYQRYVADFVQQVSAAYPRERHTSELAELSDRASRSG